jgi:hypothetical protein
MYLEVTNSMFHDLMDGDYSYSALDLIYDWFNEGNWEFDRVAIRCEIEETDEDEIRDQYNLDEDEDVEQFLANNTAYLGEGDLGHVFVSF